ncbi:MAG: hypothetical protein E7016_01245 [Alphaproteobacteria bacterium]|nr:hypothetical protein [Alphaproteobacteria bacterium]
MRKYFLLSAVALLANITATSVSAGTNTSANVNVVASINHVNEINCSVWNFGNIFVKSNQEDGSTIFSVIADYELNASSVDAIVSSYGYEPARCNFGNFNQENYTFYFPEKVTLTSTDGGEIYLTDLSFDSFDIIAGTLSYDSTNASYDGNYTGSFIFTLLSE